MHTISSESERDVFILKTGPLNFTIVTGGLNPEGYYQNQWNLIAWAGIIGDQIPPNQIFLCGMCCTIY